MMKIIINLENVIEVNQTLIYIILLQIILHLSRKFVIDEVITIIIMKENRMESINVNIILNYFH